MNVVGIMNGTSLDGIDFVLCRYTATGIKYLDMATSKFPRKLEDSLKLCVTRKANVEELAEAHFELGRFYAKELQAHAKRRRWKINLVGLHGQTVYHSSGRATLQIGEPSFLSETLRVPVVADFRPADIAAGGKGAPLATYFHKFLLREKKHPVAIQNIGGIGNVSFFSKKEQRSFDTGPGNMLIDIAVREGTKGAMKYDLDGHLGAAGVVDGDCLKAWLKHPFFKKAPPKSCGREEFGELFFEKAKKDMRGLSFQDRIATLTELTAVSIANAWRRHLPDLPQEAWISGGGARNPFLLFRLRYHLPEVRIESIETLKWPVSAIEGGAFALLAAERFNGRAPHIPSTTGAEHSARLGKICFV